MAKRVIEFEPTLKASSQTESFKRSPTRLNATSPPLSPSSPTPQAQSQNGATGGHTLSLRHGSFGTDTDGDVPLRPTPTRTLVPILSLDESSPQLMETDLFASYETARTAQLQSSNATLREAFSMPDVVSIKDVRRESRTKTGSTLAGAERMSNPFARKCINFYNDTWHIAEFGYQQPTQRTLEPKFTELKYAVDTNQSTSQIIEVLKKSAAFPVTPILSGNLSVAKTAAAPTTKKETAVVGKTKKQRFVVFRFETPQGPPVLEVSKDKKAGKEVIYLEVSSVVQSVDTMFEVQVEDTSYEFQCDSADAADEWVDTIVHQVTSWTRLSAAQASRHTLSTPTPQKSGVTHLEAVWATLRQVPGTRQRRAMRTKATMSHLLDTFEASPSSALRQFAIKDIEPLKEYLGHRFQVVCKGLEFGLRIPDGRHQKINVEPFYCRMALFDLRKEVTISEWFHFDFNPQTMGLLSLDPRHKDPETCAHTAIFSVPEPHAQIVLVLRVEKLLQKDFALTLDTYAKSGDSEKAALKQNKTVAANLSRHGENRMPFVWAARPIFRADGQLDMDASFTDFFREELDKLLDSDILASIKAGYKGRGIVGGMFHASVEPVSEQPGEYLTVTPSLLPVKPFDLEGKQPVRREVACFLPPPQWHMSYTNFLYIYPTSLNLAGAKLFKQNSGRNIMCEVWFLDSDSEALFEVPQQAGKCIFGKSSCARFVMTASTAVSYHVKTPQFSEEIKVQMPAVVTPQHHVLFAFFHVSVKAKERKGQHPKSLIGFSFLPVSNLFEHRVAHTGISSLAQSRVGEAPSAQTNLRTKQRFTSRCQTGNHRQSQG
eukprot:m.78351 g.78351  ORF g.78351 m.78351 type:complete len:828 (-) comp12532_c0_seq2:4202-6685(-)